MADEKPDSLSSRISPVFVARGLLVVFLGLCLETLFSVGYRTVHLATHSAAKAWVAGLAGLAFCAFIFWQRHVLFSVVETWARRVAPKLAAPGISLLAGLLLRVAWLLRFHQPFTSDGDGYFQEAVNLAVRHSYGGPYWPPGFPLFLSPFFMVLGAKQWVAWMCALLLFCATWWLTQRLASLLSGSALAGYLAGWLLAVWPGYVAISNINSKEMLLGTLVAGIMLLQYRPEGEASRTRWWKTCATGVLTGCAALTQPGFTLFPAVLFLADWLRARQLLPGIVRSAVIVCLMMATILPWTAHNYRVSHRYILISTNGGSVFYTANNAHANASYSEESQRALPADTIEADRVGYQLGKQWIREHPAQFAVLAVRKQVVFLGDDGIGIYENLRRGHTTSGMAYNALKGICSLYWMLLWIVLLCAYRLLARSSRWAVWFGITFLPFVYQWAIDSVFESGSRHHMAYVGCLATLVAVALSRVASSRWEMDDPHPYRLWTLM